MNTAPSADSTLLTQVQACIAQALAGLEDRERAAALVPAAASADGHHDATAACRQRIERLDAHAQTVSAKLNAVDSELGGQEQRLRAFLAKAAALRQKLAAWAARAIG